MTYPPSEIRKAYLDSGKTIKTTIILMVLALLVSIIFLK